MKSRVTQVRRELHQGTNMVRKCKKVHRLLDMGGTGLIQWSRSFYDQGAAVMQQIMVLSCYALLNLSSLADVSTSKWDHDQSTVWTTIVLPQLQMYFNVTFSCVPHPFYQCFIVGIWKLYHGWVAVYRLDANQTHHISGWILRRSSFLWFSWFSAKLSSWDASSISSKPTSGRCWNWECMLWWLILYYWRLTTHRVYLWMI